MLGTMQCNRTWSVHYLVGLSKPEDSTQLFLIDHTGVLLHYSNVLLMFTVEQHLLLSVILFFALLVLLYIVTNVYLCMWVIFCKKVKNLEKVLQSSKFSEKRKDISSSYNAESGIPNHAV